MTNEEYKEAYSGYKDYMEKNENDNLDFLKNFDSNAFGMESGPPETNEEIDKKVDKYFENESEEDDIENMEIDLNA